MAISAANNVSSSLDYSKRRLIPRWRDSRTTAASGELDAHREWSGHTRPADLEAISKTRAEWERNKTIPYASDLVGGALVERVPAEAREAAAFLASEKSAASEAARLIALESLRLLESPREETSPLRSEPLPEPDALQVEVRKARRLVRNYPRNALGWADLSLSYAALGLQEQAVAAMRVALALASEDRFVLRSAARLWLHMNEPDRAREILLQSRRVKVDPWVLSAEIATSSVATRNSPNIKLARRMLTSRSFRPHHVAELAGSIASLELEAGKARHARRLFKQSLIEPTENSIAQVSWAIRERGLRAEFVGEAQISRSSEARTMTSFLNGEWSTSAESADLWLADEPFSSRPTIHGSYVCAVVLEDHERSIRLAQRGLLANPGDSSLRNNLVYSLASLGRLEEAASELKRVSIASANETTRVVLTATRGLIHFRSGRFAQGHSDYLQALDGARELRNQKLLASAALHFAMELIRAGSEDGTELASQALSASEEIESPDIQLLRERVRRALGRKGGTQGAKALVRSR